MSLSLPSIDAATIRFARFVAVVGLAALLVLSAIILTNAFMRWVFSEPIDGVRDWVKLVVAVAVGACLPSALAMRQNVTIRYLGAYLGRRVGARLETLLDLFGALVVLAAFGAMTWLLQVYTIELRTDGETTENIGMLVWPWWQGVSVLFMLSTLVQVLVVVGFFRALVLGGAPAKPGQSAAEEPS